MSQTLVEVKGTLQPDGTLTLDEKVNLPAGRVTVLVKPVTEPSPPLEDWWQYMQRTCREQEAAGHRFLNEEEMNAHIEWLRQGDEIDELLRQAEEDRKRREQPGC